MPRPGPRPYECVRRAWHSDRHQPIRGLIIQQIFRVVNGRHSNATKGNREWQEKLPIVVFKAEEIMYSKANSEVEYMDLETLWDRINESINIIIRRDESTETGDLLPPCVEGLKNLSTIIVGTPVYPLVTEPVERGCLKNLFSCKKDGNAFSRDIHTSGDNKQEAFQQTECDLSLRLGLYSDPCLNKGKGAASDIDIVGLLNSQEGAQLNDLTYTQNKEFTLFPMETANDPFELSTSSRHCEGEVQNAEADGQIFWQPEPTSNLFSDRVGWPAL